MPRKLPLVLSVLPLASSFSIHPGPNACGTEFTCDEGEAIKVAVVGHTSPDTDAVGAAIAYAWELLNPPPYSPGFTGSMEKQCAKAYVNRDEVNPETAFALEYFGEKQPPILEDINALPAGAVFAVVDTSAKAQMPVGTTTDVVKESLHSLVDHHKLDGVETNTPTEFDIRPIGSAGSILYHRSRAAGRVIPGHGCKQNIAGMMLATILSDTLGLTSETTTPADVAAVEYLAPLAGVSSWQDFTHQMLVAKSDIRAYSPEQIVLLDSKIQAGFTDPEGKEFKLRVAVQETVTPDLLFEQAKELGQACKTQLVRDQEDDPAVRDCLFFVIDVRESVKEFFPGFPLKATYISSPPTYAADNTNFSYVDPSTKQTSGPYAKALVMGEWFMADGAPVTPHEYELNGVSVVELPGVLSRKKQIVPGLMSGALSTTYKCSKPLDDNEILCLDPKSEISTSRAKRAVDAVIFVWNRDNKIG